MVNGPRRIVLIGYRGSGKSTVGRLLAENLKAELLDTDRLIEDRAKCSIREIVKINGWAHFRQLEKEVIAGLDTHSCKIISAGGGAILAPENRASLKKNSLVFYLRAGEKILASRIARDGNTDTQRPSLTGASVISEIGAVLKERDPIYRETADYIIDTEQKEIQDVVFEILEILKTQKAGSRYEK